MTALKILAGVGRAFTVLIKAVIIAVAVVAGLYWALVLMYAVG